MKVDGCRNFCINCKDSEQRDGSLYCNDKKSIMYGSSVESVREAPCFEPKELNPYVIRKEFITSVCEAFMELNKKSETLAEEILMVKLAMKLRDSI